jgi:uncharacterized protein (DUF433 family)
MSSWKDRIAADPARGHGDPCVRSTRVPVSTVVGSLGGGMSFAEVEAEYGITEADIRAALSYAAELVSAFGVRVPRHAGPQGDVEPHRGPVSVPAAPDRFGVATVSDDFLRERAQPEVDRRESL